MATQAEEMGVEIYPGFSAAEVLYDEQGERRQVTCASISHTY